MNNDLFPNDPAENENPTPEDAALNESPAEESPAEEAPETADVVEASPSSETPEASEEESSASSEDVPPEAPKADTPAFAEVDPAPEEMPKKSGGRLAFGILAGILALCLAIAALLATGLFGKNNALYHLFHKTGDDGIGSVQLSGFATLDGNDLYHVGFVDTSLHRTNIQTGETEIISENSVATISRYQGDLFYLSYALNDATQSYEYSYWKFIDGVNDQKLFSSNVDISSPQFTDKYIYFMSPVSEVYSGYSNRLFRAPLTGGEVETVCDLLCISYLVDGNDLYLSLGEDFAYIKLNLEDTVAYVAANPLAEGVLRSTSELSPEVLFTDYLISNAVRHGDSLYYVGVPTDIGSQNGYELCRYDIKTKEQYVFNDGTYASLFRIYGDYIFYFSSTDSSIYRMRLDGTDVTRLTAPVFGYFNTSGDKFLYINWSDIGLPSIAVCDLDGNALTDVPLYDEETRQRAEELAANSSASEDENYEDFGDLDPSEDVVILDGDGIETALDLSGE